LNSCVRGAAITGALSLKNHAGSMSSPVAVGLRRSSIRKTSISVTKLPVIGAAVCLTGGTVYLLSADTAASTDSRKQNCAAILTDMDTINRRRMEEK